MFAATLTNISDGIQYGWSSAAVVMLKREDSPVGGITEDNAFWLETLFLLGAVSALPGTSYIVDKLGRKWSAIVAGAASLLMWIVIAIATDIRFIMAARLVKELVSVKHSFTVASWIE